MSRKNERRAERQVEWLAECAEAEKEQRRKDALTMHERIEESDASPSVKDILHRMSEKLGIEFENS